MNIIMAGLDHSLAPLLLRERLSFSTSALGALDKDISALPGIEGCVALSTCNRTELYLSWGEGERPPEPGKLLCRAAGLPEALFRGALVTRRGGCAAAHLMAVAAGLESQIFGEDQIVSQVGQALAIARACAATGPVLEALFREAAAAGKEFKSKIKLNRIAPSAAQRAAALLAVRAGGLEGKRALVIGNGEMGRLAAAALAGAGCAVTITLRTYRHGETVVPPGCAVVPYDDRYAAMEGADVLCSATASPHCTVTRAGMELLRRPPRLLCDLAVPRDIEPAVGALPGVTLLNVDDLGEGTVDRTVPEAGVEILRRHRERLTRWAAYRDSLSALEQIKEDITRRVLTTDELDGLEPEELVELAVGRAVDLVAGGLGAGVTPENLGRCAALIKTHTQARKKEDHHGKRIPVPNLY